MSISNAGEAMARRRRNLSPCFDYFASLSMFLVWYQERTSWNFSKLAQSRRRRFTDLLSGVFWLASDADPLRTCSHVTTASVGPSSEPSDPKSTGENLDLVAKELGPSQIRRARFPSSAILMVLVGRDPYAVPNRRSSSSPSWLSGFLLSTSQHRPSSAAPAPWSFSRYLLRRHVVDLNLGIQRLVPCWAWQLMGCVLVLGLMGLMNPKHMSVASQPISPILYDSGVFDSDLKSPASTVSSHSYSPSKRYSLSFSVDWWFSPMSIGFHLRLRNQKIMEIVIFALLTWRFLVEHLPQLGALALPRYQTSFCRGQKRSFPSSSSSKERTISPSSSALLLWCSYRCPCVARSTLVCEGCFSEASSSVIVKGSSNRCFVSFGYVAELWIALSALAAVAISNNRSLSVLFVYLGDFSILASNVVKVGGLYDDVKCLRFGNASSYLYNYCFYAFCLAHVALLLTLVVMNLLLVTVSSLDGV